MVAREFSKPQPARQLEARARARALGVRVEVVSEARRYTTRSQSNPGEVYTLKRTPVGWACSCLGYEHTGCCKHLGAVERRAEREGWSFGSVAPLSRVARYFPLDEPETALRASAAAPAPVADLAKERQARRARTADALATLYGPDGVA